MYLPYKDRTPDTQYADLLRMVRDQGLPGPTRQGEDVLTYLNYTMRFPFANGFPMITERSIKGFWRKPIAELLVFINGGRTMNELKAAGCDWWEEWTTPEKTRKRGLADGDIGPGSYGAAFHDFPMPDGSTFNQIENLVLSLREHPYDRRHVVTNWIPYLVARTSKTAPQVTIAPCHGQLYARILDDRLHLTMVQRSGDTPVGVPSNMVQYAAFAMMLGQVTGFEPATYSHHIIDAHIYANQLPNVDELVAREPRRFPTVTITEAGRKVTDIFAFKPEHFELSDYDPHPGMRGIPVAT